MGQRKRYRVFVEHESIGVFDRREGRLYSLADPDGRMAATVDGTTGISEVMRSALATIPGLLPVDPNQWEQPICTPYAKSPVFAPAPRRIYWELTRQCNLRCRSCFNRYAATPELPTTRLLSLAQTLYEAGVCELRLTGGEPTLRPDIWELVSAFHELGFYLSMGSNGVWAARTLTQVEQAPLDWIIISVDGATAQVHEALRGPGTFAATLQALRALAMGNRRLRVSTLIRRGHACYDALRPLAELCLELGVESLNCIPLRPVVDDPQVLDLQLQPAEYQRFIAALWRLREELPELALVTALDLERTADHDRIYFKRKACAAGREGAVVSPRGEIYGCSYSPASDPTAAPELRAPYVAGNLGTEDFLSVWNDSERWSIFRDEERYKHAQCRSCEHFNRGRCIGNCPIMSLADPGAFDPYCYVRSDPSAGPQPVSERAGTV